MEQGKVDIQVSRESGIKKVQDVSDEVREEEPLNAENFFIDGNDISDNEEISNADRELLLILLTEKILLLMLKNSLKNQMRQKWKLFILKKKSKKREQMSTDDYEKRENVNVEKV